MTPFFCLFVLFFAGVIGRSRKAELDSHIEMEASCASKPSVLLADGKGQILPRKAGCHQEGHDILAREVGKFESELCLRASV